MNTSHNKDRIIDDGLKVTIINAIHLPFDLSLCTSSSRAAIETEEDNSDQTNLEEKKVTPLKKNINKIPKYTKNEIFILSSNQNSLKSKHDGIILNESLELVPSTSTGINHSNRKERRLGWSRKFLSESEENIEIDYSKTRLCTGKEILGYMNDNINNEQHYLHYFFQLIYCEEKCKGNDMDDFQIVHLNETKPVRCNLLTKEKETPIVLSVTESKNKPHAKRSLPLPIDSSDIMFSRDTLDRIKMRKDILFDYQLKCDDEQSYTEYLSKLIDLEENLAES